MKKILLRSLLGLVFLYPIACYLYGQSLYHVLEIYPQTNGSKCHNLLTEKNRETVRVLVVDGGGIYGITPLMIMNYWEQKTGKPMKELFDFFIGTGSGAVIVSAINIPGENEKPKYSSADMIKVYQNFCKKIFEIPFINRILTLNGILAPLLSEENLNKEYLNFFGNHLTFGSLLSKVAITAYDIERTKSVILKSWLCNETVSRYLVADIFTIATDSPHLFSPVILKDFNHQEQSALVAGFLFATNPSLEAIKEAYDLYPNAKRFVVVHLGTGIGPSNFYQLNANAIQTWGMLDWYKPIMKILFQSQDIFINDSINITQEFGESIKLEYYDLNRKIYSPSPLNTSNEHFKRITERANVYIQEQQQRLDDIAQELMRASY